MSSDAFFTSLTDAMEKAAIYGATLVTVTLSVNTGRVTTLAYRRTFDITDKVGEDQTSELTAMVALLRQYGKAKGQGSKPFEVRFAIGGPVTMFVGAKLADWLEKKAVPRETVPQEVVAAVEGGIAETVQKRWREEQRRSELEGLNVEAVRKQASELKVAGAWRLRKAELIEAIISTEQDTEAETAC